MFKFNNNNDFILLFEKKLAEFTGAKYVVLTDSCTNALFLSLKYYSNNAYIPIQASELLIPERTYISVPQVVKNAGFTPIFNDERWKGKYKIGNLPIYDCAVGFKKDMYKKDTFMCLSFQERKALKLGKGGAILLDDREAYKTLKRMAHDGRDSSIPVSEDKNIISGYHMNMTPDIAAAGVIKLNLLSKEDINSNIKTFKDYPNISKIYKY